MPRSRGVAATPRDVLLFVPNLIGYARVACCLLSFALMLAASPDAEADGPAPHWVAAAALYLAGFVGDLLDGWAARRWDQQSTFGGVLDMVTDRCGTLGLLYVLGGAARDPRERLALLLLQVLDIASHWVQMQSALAVAGAHHKSDAGNAGKHFLVRWFYGYYWFFGYLCVGAEFTYILLYVRGQLALTPGAAAVAWRSWADRALLVTAPGCVAKQLVNVMQLGSSCYTIAQYDADQRNGSGSTSKRKS